MESIVDAVLLLAIATIGAALARRLGLLAPLLLLVTGLILSFVPGLLEIHLDHELVLVGILPPLLYVAALQTSLPAFRFNLRPILSLAVGLVVVTAVVIGFALHAIVPAAPLWSCLALGAIVAPPDAVAATAVARRIGLPRRVVTILEGESLLNDATALVMLRVCLAAAAGAVGVLDIGLEIAQAAGGGVLLGLAAAVLAAKLHRRIEEPLLDDAVSLLTPFVVVLVAEALHLSSIVAVVVAGLYLGHRIPQLLSAAARLQMDAVWRLITFLLEGTVFLLVGLQVRDVLRAIETPAPTVVLATAVTIALLLAVRFAWLLPAAYLSRLVPAMRRRDPAPDPGASAVIGWAGMRGVVTLAAALALTPVEVLGVEYPRELLIWIAFATIVVTLLLHGTTLPAFARLMRLRRDDPMQDVLAEAGVQQQASAAARARLDALADGAPEEVVERLRSLSEIRANLAWERLGSQEQETPSRAYARLRREMIDAEREVFRVARDEGRIAEEVLDRAQRGLDLEETQLRKYE
ncbi:Na+/H+ antiporter [Spirilliplanes yamanashiensis]|uniref:Na+/H+ antiporter n=1 Tax=Spirilliplanes yamanashiensis TaxID=42233 RepID=A0A8J4DLM7_9ACTN|nr:Na+/H+ antiporter [Spirilliplanes yamanashiensis]MDP9818796.1 CPA1 family monovalent cation:H+ antiporter [Spirilliplanes yamanashiensis]GIJ05250.1 Na+/H+ antiporter [Spirilliplanes yamanashiensis]